MLNITTKGVMWISIAPETNQKYKKIKLVLPCLPLGIVSLTQQIQLVHLLEST